MNQTDKAPPPVCLTIAGLDPSGGAGIIADVKTFTRLGCFATAAVTSLTYQNTVGVFGADHQTADAVRRQVEPVFDDYQVAAMKTGMLPTRDIIEEVAAIITERGICNMIVDPVVRSTTGFDLIDDQALEALVTHLFRLAALITPNIPEAERISKSEIKDEPGIMRAAELMHEMGARNVLIKGGHAFEKGNQIVKEPKAKDYLFINGNLTILEADWIDTKATHGTGCALAAAITANLAWGNTLEKSVRNAKQFVNDAIRSAPGLGEGHSPINI
ncbi:MAG: bifunctional hydroxymethylpyrimidine kinase/phosphomethylpyrimidine kinase [Pyrinomonadaceae bacterium]